MLKNLKNVNFKSKEDQKREKQQNLTLGLLLGAAIGTVAGIFSQTDKGKCATKKVVSTAKDLTEKSKGVVSDSIKKIKKSKNKETESPETVEHVENDKDSN